MVPTYLPDVIEAIHAGMQEESDPKHVQTLATCLRALTQIQADYMGQNGAGANARDALISQLTGGGDTGQAGPPEAVPQYQGQG